MLKKCNRFCVIVLHGLPQIRIENFAKIIIFVDDAVSIMKVLSADLFIV
jgi:hypothetical protein